MEIITANKIVVTTVSVYLFQQMSTNTEKDQILCQSLWCIIPRGFQPVDTMLKFPGFQCHWEDAS